MTLLKKFPTTAFLLTLIVAVFLSMSLSGGTTLTPNLLRWGAIQGVLVHSGQYWRVISAAFIHIGVLHLLFNGYAASQLIPLGEVVFGSAETLGLFFLTAAGGGALSAWGNPHNIAAGASGAIFGLAGALITALLSHRTALPDGAQRKLLQAMVPFVGYNLIIGLSISGIDNYGHIGGLITGALAGLVWPLHARRLRGVFIVACALVLGWTVTQQFTLARVFHPSVVESDVQNFLSIHDTMMDVLKDIETLGEDQPPKESKEHVAHAIAQLATLHDQQPQMLQSSELADRRRELTAIVDDMTALLHRVDDIFAGKSSADEAALSGLESVLDRYMAWSEQMITWANQYGYDLQRVPQNKE